LYLKVLSHTDFGLLAILFECKEVGAWVQIPVKTVNLVRLNVISRNHSLARHVLIRRVKNVGDLCICPTLLFLDINVF
jgi:hypothetical protein